MHVPSGLAGLGPIWGVSSGKDNRPLESLFSTHHSHRNAAGRNRTAKGNRQPATVSGEVLVSGLARARPDRQPLPATARGHPGFPLLGVSSPGIEPGVIGGQAQLGSALDDTMIETAGVLLAVIKATCRDNRQTAAVPPETIQGSEVIDQRSRSGWS